MLPSSLEFGGIDGCGMSIIFFPISRELSLSSQLLFGIFIQK